MHGGEGLQEHSEFTPLYRYTQRTSDSGFRETSREHKEMAKWLGTVLEMAVSGPGSQQHSLIAVDCSHSFSRLLYLPCREEKSRLLPGTGLSQEITGPREKWNVNLLHRVALFCAAGPGPQVCNKITASPHCSHWKMCSCLCTTNK